MIKRGIFGLLMLVVLAVGQSGCVFKFGDDQYSSDDHTKVELRNRSQISQLPLGTPLATVQAELGNPDFVDAVRGKSGEYRVLRYRTQHVHSDGETTRDETTPLVFLDGKLSGIGEIACSKALDN